MMRAENLLLDAGRSENKKGALAKKGALGPAKFAGLEAEGK